jgi:hypothetical protein
MPFHIPILAGVICLSHPAAPACAPPPASTLSLRVDDSVAWKRVIGQSGLLLGVQHTLRMSQEKTRAHLDGPFWHDYFESVRGLHGWNDGNSRKTNYMGHPLMGAATAFVLIQNDPKGRGLEWAPRSPTYWKSRFKGLGWAAVYSTSFELAPWGEAGIGNVGQDRGTMAFVDLVVTPLGGFGWMLLEDYLDATLIKRMERNGIAWWTRVARVVLNPGRSIANMVQFERPSYRATR